jgi:hypothetical protein
LVSGLLVVRIHVVGIGIRAKNFWLNEGKISARRFSSSQSLQVGIDGWCIFMLLIVKFAPRIAGWLRASYLQEDSAHLKVCGQDCWLLRIMLLIVISMPRIDEPLRTSCVDFGTRLVFEWCFWISGRIVAIEAAALSSSSDFLQQQQQQQQISAALSSSNSSSSSSSSFSAAAAAAVFQQQQQQQQQQQKEQLSVAADPVLSRFTVQHQDFYLFSTNWCDLSLLCFPFYRLHAGILQEFLADLSGISPDTLLLL